MRFSALYCHRIATFDKHETYVSNLKPWVGTTFHSVCVKIPENAGQYNFQSIFGE